LRILVLIYEFPPVGGGGGKAAEDICQFLAGQGHELRVLTAHYRDLPAREQRDGFEVWRVASGRRLAYKADLRAMGGYVLAGTAAAVRMVQAWRPQVIHAHFAVPTGVVAWSMKRTAGVPYVLTAHLGDVPGGVPEKTDKWFRWFYPFTPPIWRDAAQVVAVSEHTRTLALSHYPGVDIQVIPNGVNVQALTPQDLQPGRPPRLVFAGRFVPQKAPLEVIRTLAALRDLPWTCTMLGDGPLRPQVEHEIAASGLQDRVRLPGWVTPQEVVEVFGRSDMLFMPSLTEGLPVVGVQALAMGLAVVASRVGGFGELVEDGENGFLHTPDDAQGFSTSLRSLIQEPGRLGEFRLHSRARAARFDICAVGQAYEAVLKRAAGEAVDPNGIRAEQAIGH
jgi:glycosyltransferase involved in cell wall biosynthesis